MKAIIIAGGLGTRLRPLTYSLPKPIVPLVNRPFVFHQMELLKRFGINDVILNLHYLSDNIKSIIDQEKERGFRINYSLEEKPLGTAGAVKNAEEFFDGQPMLIFNGDVLTDINLAKMIAFHEANKAMVTIATTRVDNPTIYGLVLTDKDSRILEFREKPTWEQAVSNTINAGVYIVDPSVFKLVPKGKEFSFEKQLYPTLLENGERLFGYKMDAYWMDIGDPNKYLKAHHDILSGYVMATIPGNKVSTDVWMEEDVNISKSAKVRGKALFGKHSRIAEDVTFEETAVIGEGVVVSKGAKLKNCVIHDGAVIGENARIEDSIICARCTVEELCFVGAGTVLAEGSILKKGTRIGGGA